MKLSTLGRKFVVLVTGACLMLSVRPAAHSASSLSELDIEYCELKVTFERLLEENKQLRKSLAETEKTLADMRKNLMESSGESEFFKRQTMQMKLRMDALGLDSFSSGNVKLEQRLLTAVNDLRVSSSERRGLSEALVRLTEAASFYAKSATGFDPQSRLTLEAEIRNANAMLGADTSHTVAFESLSPTAGEGMVISVKEDLALVVMNLGSRQGVKVGMPFRIMRKDRFIGTVRAVDVREIITGAVIQNLNSEKERVQIGDHLKVDAHQ